MALQMGLSVKDFKKNYFTRPHVTRRIDRGKWYYLRYQGMNIRRDARRQVKAPTKPPIPGPETRANRGLSMIFYAFDRSTSSTVVGPVKFDQQPWREMTVPEVVEKGGFVTPNPGYDLLPRRVRPAPYMVPALEKNMATENQKTVWKKARHKAGT